MARKPTNIDTFARILIEDLEPWQRPCPGEMTYVSVGAKLIREHLGEYYQEAGLEPPQISAIRNWFYYGCPDWVIAFLHSTIRVKANARDLVMGHQNR